MLSINNFNAETLDLLTDKEKQFNRLYVDKLINYAKGKESGELIKNLNAGASAIARKQQSRSAMAVLMRSMSEKQQNLQQVTQEVVIDKEKEAL